MSSSRIAAIERLAKGLAEGARLELHLTPKPGLVDLADRGSHPDLSSPIMERSVGMVSDCLRNLVQSLGAGQPFEEQVEIARRAEGRMRAAFGSNTHKGFLFLGGFLLIARWRAGSSDERAIREAIRSLARRFFAAKEAADSNGRRARERFHVGGIVGEALGGFPSLFETALPAYIAGAGRYGDPTTACFHMMARLMQTVEDTTTLHRGGEQGLLRIRRDGRILESLIDGGGPFLPYLERLNDEYVGMNLTMGGVADMIGLALGWLKAEGYCIDGAKTAERSEFFHEIVARPK